MRPPPLVHSEFDHTGYTPALISFARAKGKAGYPGDGSNRWPAAHSLDVGAPVPPGARRCPGRVRLHAVADEGVPLREIAEVIGRNLGVPAVSIAPEEVVDYFDFLAFFLSLDNPASSALTQELLDWHPTHPGTDRRPQRGPLLRGLTERTPKVSGRSFSACNVFVLTSVASPSSWGFPISQFAISAAHSPAGTLDSHCAGRAGQWAYACLRAWGFTWRGLGL